MAIVRKYMKIYTENRIFETYQDTSVSNGDMIDMISKRDFVTYQTSNNNTSLYINTDKIIAIEISDHPLPERT